MTTYIDDQDLDKVTYTGEWVRGGVSLEYKGTVASSTRAGDYFTVTFKGTNIAVFGTFDITSAGVVTTYSVDGAPPAQVTSQAGSHDTHRQQFWRSGMYPMDVHKLAVNMTKVNSDPQPGEGTVWFDYFLITDPSIASTSPPNPTPPVGQSKSVPIGAIVGGVIGGLFFILALAFVYLLYRHRTRIQIVEENSDDENLTPARAKHMTIEPFVLTATNTLSGSGTSTSASTEQFSPSVLISGPPLATRKSVVTLRPGTGHSTQTSIGNSTEGAHNSLPSSSTAANPDQTVTAPERNSAMSNKRRAERLRVDTDTPHHQTSPVSATEVLGSLPLQHVDSGVRAADVPASEPPVVRVELPPVYSPT